MPDTPPWSQDPPPPNLGLLFTEGETPPKAPDSFVEHLKPVLTEINQYRDKSCKEPDGKRANSLLEIRNICKPLAVHLQENRGAATRSVLQPAVFCSEATHTALQKIFSDVKFTKVITDNLELCTSYVNYLALRGMS